MAHRPLVAKDLIVVTAWEGLVTEKVNVLVFDP